MTIAPHLNFELPFFGSSVQVIKTNTDLPDERNAGPLFEQNKSSSSPWVKLSFLGKTKNSHFLPIRFHLPAEKNTGPPGGQNTGLPDKQSTDLPDGQSWLSFLLVEEHAVHRCTSVYPVAKLRICPTGKTQDFSVSKAGLGFTHGLWLANVVPCYKLRL